MSKLREKYTEITYNALNIEGVAVTIAETQDLLNNKNIYSLKDTDNLTATNFINSLSYINSIIEKGFDKYELIEYMKRINLYLLHGLHSEAGNIRYSNIKVSGSNYIPKIPVEFEIREDIMKNIDNILDDPLELYCYITRNQIFADGNKRTALLITNLLLYNDNKYFSVDEEYADEYRIELVEMYETGNTEKFKWYMQRYIKEYKKDAGLKWEVSKNY